MHIICVYDGFELGGITGIGVTGPTYSEIMYLLRENFKSYKNPMTWHKTEPPNKQSAANLSEFGSMIEQEKSEKYLDMFKNLEQAKDFCLIKIDNVYLTIKFERHEVYNDFYRGTIFGDFLIIRDCTFQMQNMIGRKL